MIYFQWTEDMAIDHGPIDEAHKKLIHHVSQLHAATSQGHGHEIVTKLLEELLNETIQHTRQEEQYMASINYPRIEEHRKGHTRFVIDLRNLQAKQASGSMTVASQLSTLLRDWLSVHIRRYDKDLFRFVKNKEREAVLAARAAARATRSAGH